MKTECPSCKHQFQVIDVDSVMSERKLMREVVDATKEAEESAKNHEKLARIFCDMDEIMLTMRPRYCAHPTIDGKYPCWIVWLPKDGSTTRKTLKGALIDFVDQSSPNNQAPHS